MLGMTWICPSCNRTFRRVSQRHACGVGDRSTLLHNRPPSLAALFTTLESVVTGFGAVEVVTRDRYALFRTTRIFVDLTVRMDALRVVIHLDREVCSPLVTKVGHSGKRVSHVAMIRTPAELRTITPVLREAYALAAGKR
jgi:predicted transport protein